MKWAELADEDTVKRTSEALRDRGVHVELAEKREEALKKLMDLIPSGKVVMTGSSTTLKEIGFEDLLKSGKHPWNNLKDTIVNEKDPFQKNGIAKK